VMQIGSLAILASKEYASRGVEEVKAVFEHWAELVSFAFSTTTRCSTSDSR